jgi:hypothetical protein
VQDLDLISSFIFRKAYSPPRLKLQSKKDKDQKSGGEVAKPVEAKKAEVAVQQRASLNLQDSVENSFREKLVIQVHTVDTVEQLQREAGLPDTYSRY